jgi:cytidyltransferase-like protein
MNFDPDQLYAVWDGRFQPFHLGHVAVIRAILNHFHLPLVVMIIQSTAESPSNDYVAQVNPHHAPKRNPLTLWERFCMIQDVVRAESWTDRVTALGIPRPDVYWKIASSFYPTRRFICVTDKDEYERSKVSFWHSLGEEVRVVPSANLPMISATKVKQLIKTTDEWSKMMHEVNVDFFAKVKGPERFRAADM